MSGQQFTQPTTAAEVLNEAYWKKSGPLDQKIADHNSHVQDLARKHGLHIQDTDRLQPSEMSLGNMLFSAFFTFAGAPSDSILPSYYDPGALLPGRIIKRHLKQLINSAVDAAGELAAAALAGDSLQSTSSNVSGVCQKLQAIANFSRQFSINDENHVIERALDSFSTFGRFAVELATRQRVDPFTVSDEANQFAAWAKALMRDVNFPNS